MEQVEKCTVKVIYETRSPGEEVSIIGDDCPSCDGYRDMCSRYFVDSDIEEYALKLFKGLQKSI
jgi:hypothetical protein